MANELMQKVGELLDMAGLDKEVIKSVTEKLEVEKVEESADVKHDIKGGEGTEAAPVDGAINKGGEKIEKDEKSEEQEKAPVDPKANEGGIEVAEAEEIARLRADLETLKEEYAKLVAEKIVDEAKEECDKEEDKKECDKEADEEEADESLEEALGALLLMLKEAFEQTKQMKSDFDVLKEEYAKLVAEKIIDEAKDDEVATEAEEDKEKEEDKAEEKNAEEHLYAVKAGKEDEEAKKDEEKGEKEDAKEEEKKADKEAKNMRKDMKKEKEDYDEAHGKVDESLDETVEAIAKDVTTLSEEAIIVQPKKVKIAKAFSVFSNPINESAQEEGKEEKKSHKVFTLFPNL